MQLNGNSMVIAVTKSLQLLYVVWSTYARDGQKYSSETFEEENKLMKNEIQKIKVTMKWLVRGIPFFCVVFIATLLGTGKERNVNLKMLN